MPTPPPGGAQGGVGGGGGGGRGRWDGVTEHRAQGGAMRGVFGCTAPSPAPVAHSIPTACLVLGSPPMDLGLGGGGMDVSILPLCSVPMLHFQARTP